MAEGVIAVDVRRRLLFANASADRLLGLSETAVGRMVAELIRSPQVQEAVDAALAGPGPYRGEVALATREPLGPSPARILEVLGTHLPGAPSPGAVLVFHDVTELRRLERMRQDFVANVSHELKTPLASIKAYTETLLDWALHDETVNVRFLQRIEEQADRLDRLVLDLLSLARLEAGQEVYEHAPLALAPTIQAASEAHRGRAEAKGIDYIVDLVALDPRVEVYADEEAVRQILDNLIDNAIKYTPEGKRVVVSSQAVGKEVLMEVSDTGNGIPRPDLPRIFERFYRVDKARSRELGGTGLGLAIVKHLVQSLGGRVDVTSRVGSGSRFTVLLPRFQPPDH
jgi:two-component system phosphate regulon sensor histidine kinase PhoR